MYANELLNLYKEAKNYTQDKQIASDLKLSQQKISNIRNERRQLSDNEAIFLAEALNLDIKTVLVKLAADKADNNKAKQAWLEIAKKIKGQNYQVYSAVLAALTYSLEPSIQSNVKCALCTLC
ncbi:DUF3693 domain-containing protein [Photobacterium leiognathi]|uniref:DUF3693 domain-containing protein n=1 Tax=Photobacterium leiognathi TaxID=553611 RepID=UPI0027388283|nr:DUF3693 domain-containing protein [Photobacterium leiognathi]